MKNLNIEKIQEAGANLRSLGFSILYSILAPSIAYLILKIYISNAYNPNDTLLNGLIDNVHLFYYLFFFQLVMWTVIILTIIKAGSNLIDSAESSDLSQSDKN